MQVRNFAAILLAALALCSCSSQSIKTDSESQQTDISEVVLPYIQEKEHLYISDEAHDVIKQEYTPLNYDNQIGMWFPYMDYEEYMKGLTETEFRAEVRLRFEEAKAKSVNTVYVHVRPCGDAYYQSSIFPKGTYLDGDYDPLQIMLEEAHSLSLSLHAWINPLRCQTEQELPSLSDDYIVKQWAEKNNEELVNIVNGRYYLNPAYEEVIMLICSEVDELVRNYDIDGLHIDDYFYPTTSPDFDKTAFEKSGHNDLTIWRLENCNRLIHSIFESVKRIDSNILFGISPQGNIKANYSTQYADVKLWCEAVGFCDYIVPQIYYGFKNENCPFAETLSEWEKIRTAESVSLVIGLAAYKQGQEDKWAGASGELEWIENNDIINQQIELINNSTADGYALYY